MTKENILTVRWNNLLALGLGALFAAYTAVALGTPVMSELAAFIGVMVLGVLY